MAIQIWDEATQSYKGVELARYGVDGKLNEALVWDGTRYRRVWPRYRDFVDDFTSPTLHERWMLFDGAYTPPGLSGATVLGPEIDDTCDLRVAGTGPVVIYLVDENVNPQLFAALTNYGHVQLGEQLSAASGFDSFALRRAHGAWSVLHDGQLLTDANGVSLSMPDVVPVPVSMALEVSGTVTSVTYTRL